MKIKLIGLGQCGSFVVYDVIAYLFDLDESSKTIKATPQSQWKRFISRSTSKLNSRGASWKLSMKKFFTGLKTPDIPEFFVIDGNRKNAVVDGLLGEGINKKLGPLQVLVAALTLTNRNNGCHLGQVGEYVFCKEKEIFTTSKMFNRLKTSEQIEINTLVFAGGGGSGSGGAPALNKELCDGGLRNKDTLLKDPLLINILVMPPLSIADRKQRWNTGRCIMRLSKIHKQNALLLFSNLSESLNDQYYVNRYISKLIVRLANFGYTGNVPKVATDIDRKDLKAFFSGKPAFVGMSSLGKDKDEPSQTEIETMVEQALAPRKPQATETQETNEDNISGLSIEATGVLEKMIFQPIKMVMIVIGLTPKYVGKVDIVDIVKQKVAKKLDTDPSKLDCRAYSYTSPSEIELTIFFRNSDYLSPHLYYFLNSYLEWYVDETLESEYLKRILKGELDNEFLDSIRNTLREEVKESVAQEEIQDEKDSDEDNVDWLDEFKFQIDKELGNAYLQRRKGKVTSTS
jgi:hypothetical protein